ncbi:Transcriptional regulatory protein PHO23 [Dufourea novaeangliae]|uniref:Transcriptional regulatory protein PHO23 n=1 Tax=Dufourea novaeangliae TaxID=178035 RepID=A0A154NXY4_DUFNO|nr:Transcriptional regulatory protein PHO23 [Dufourea novaeangliae]
MEDEDGESKVVDTWNVLGEQQLKDTSLGNSLKSSIDNTYSDVIEEEKQLLRYNSIASKDSSSKNNSTGSQIVFKGFKKRILAQAQEIQTNTSRSIGQEPQLSHSNTLLKNSKEKKVEIKRGKITEYAQYLGLQPSSKNKCLKCYSSSNLCSVLKQNLCTCNTTMTPMPSTSESSTVSHSSNFKITRKVYLCAACGTYFENWNLFLHMRDIHKRHICLFCLGMFGQAERLSYHLTKNHSVPEMAFTSVEDFYGAFKGSCYLVCCTCEKVFSETDNFYNHFCSPTSKQDVTASICTLCRQTGSHASTCSLAIDTSREANSAVSPPTQTSIIPTHILDRTVNIGNKSVSRKSIKNNRSKHIEDGVSNQQKVHTHIKKANNKTVSQLNESPTFSDILSSGENSQNEVQNVVKDTVSETIMEVSKCVEDSCEEKEETSEREFCQNVSEIKSSIDVANHNKPYDSVIETIMEVSRCLNDTLDTFEKLESDSDEAEKPDIEIVNSTEDINIRTRELDTEHKEAEENTTENNRMEVVLETKDDSSSEASESPVHSPVSRSLFSPQHESLASDLQTKEENCKNETTENINVPNESQSSVSFNAVASSDRSLVIKICTNRNSQFSVTSNTGGIENHDTSKESEENNNAESPLRENKKSNALERDMDNDNSDQANEGDSDSDSFKLAVVDSNAEEIDEVEETDELNVTSQTKCNSNTDVAENGNQINEATEESTAEIDTNERQEVNEESKDVMHSEENDGIQSQMQPSDGIMLAGEDVPSIDLNVDGTLDSLEIEDLLKRCIQVASPICVYCNHARHIAVNGKQLGLHMLGEHKFQPQHPAIIIQSEQFIIRVKKSLDELDLQFFNLDSYSSSTGTYNVPDVRTYECFHCRFHSAVHKELYLHNRKMHQKTILICIMCKSTFYSYSELLCHLCPGTYSPNINVKYRCCLCPTGSLPSAFRLMVHLRKRHHACDVCLESTGNQQRLSNHVWKHKLHHLCYRCGIAYRNKPDITKHLFWKHGTESVLCKKCLQKKWPHIYHFCIPPTAFVCEECGSSFSRAVALKVHKRLHSGDQPYGCSECSDRFISRKLLSKHENAHKEPPPISTNLTDSVNQQQLVTDEEKIDKEKLITTDSIATTSDSIKESKEPVKKVVDVYDLPPLNLSSESDTDSEEEKVEIKEPTETEKAKSIEESAASPIACPKSVSPLPATDIVEVEQNEEEKEQGAQIMDGIWDNFKTYTASLQKKEPGNDISIDEQEPETDVAFLRSIVLADHDYCVVWSEKEKEGESGSKVEDKEEVNSNGDQDHTSKVQRSPSGSNGIQSVNESDPNRKKVKSPKKKKQSGSTSSSDSSSDSDSSSCSCGTNCSCSSSSSGSSSSSSSSSDSDSSTSDGSPKKQSSRKERKKEKETAQESESAAIDVENKGTSAETKNGDATISADPVCPPQIPLKESDLETDETETDEDFYDEHPQQLANKLLAEKRNQLLLLAAVAPASVETTVPLNNGLTDTAAIPSPDPMPGTTEDQPVQQKRKVKTKKRKKGERTKQRNAVPAVESIKLNIPKAFYQKNNPCFSASSPVLMQQSINSAPSISTSDIQTMNVAVEQQTIGITSQNISGSGSETENKRSSKRKRVPKRFYGDSSDEEVEKQPTMKWRKMEAPSFAAVPTVKPMPPRLSFGGKTVAYRAMESQQENLRIATASATESEEPAESSSDSSDTEVEAAQQQIQARLPESNPPIPERPVNLYCYCQCPYDEVSEMIACDGEDCRIEWFHFECVGIMVPPKGKWYCPDCRKKHDIVQNSEDYFD